PRIRPASHYRILIGTTTDGPLRRDDGDVTGPGCQASGLRAGLDHTDHGHVADPLADRRQPHRGSGVAGNDEALHAVTCKRLRCLQRVAHDRLRALGAVRQTSGVAEIDEPLPRQLRRKGLEDREAADAGIEDADRRIHSGRMCGKRMTSRMEGESVKNITSRSMPTPRPAVGGIPYSSART